MQRRTLSILFSVLVALAAVFIAPSAAQAAQRTPAVSATALPSSAAASQAASAAVPASVLAQAWYGWEDLGGAPVGAPAVSSSGPGQLDFFVRWSDNALWHRSYNGSWSGWESLGGALASAPAAVSWGPDRIDVAANSSGTMWHAWWT